MSQGKGKSGMIVIALLVVLGAFFFYTPSLSGIGDFFVKRWVSILIFVYIGMIYTHTFFTGKEDLFVKANLIGGVVFAILAILYKTGNTIIPGSAIIGLFMGGKSFQGGGILAATIVAIIVSYLAKKDGEGISTGNQLAIHLIVGFILVGPGTALYDLQGTAFSQIGMDRFAGVIMTQLFTAILFFSAFRLMGKFMTPAAGFVGEWTGTDMSAESMGRTLARKMKDKKEKTKQEEEEAERKSKEFDRQADKIQSTEQIEDDPLTKLDDYMKNLLEQTEESEEDEERISLPESNIDRMENINKHTQIPR